MSILPLPLAPIIPLLGLPTDVTIYTVTTTPGDDGLPQVSEVATTMTAVVHPISGRDMERATGGRRNTAGLQIFARQAIPLESQLSYAEPSGSTQRWLIIHTEDWLAQGGHCRAFAVAP